MEKITVVKIGGNVIDDPAVLKRFIADFAAMPGPKILVHGGGKVATRLAERLELKVQMVDGRRITDKGTLDVVTMVYAGLVNKQLVASLQAEGCNALGMSGADGNAVTARRRAPQPIDYGFVGDIEKVDSRLLGRRAGQPSRRSRRTACRRRCSSREKSRQQRIRHRKTDRQRQQRKGMIYKCRPIQNRRKHSHRQTQAQCRQQGRRTMHRHRKQQWCSQKQASISRRVITLCKRVTALWESAGKFTILPL